MHALVEICMSTCFIYAVEVSPLTKKDMSMLDHLDRAVYCIFGCTSSEDIQFLKSVLDRPGLSISINERLVGFMGSFSRSFSWAAMLSLLFVVDAYCRFVILFLLLFFFKFFLPQVVKIPEVKI